MMADTLPVENSHESPTIPSRKGLPIQGIPSVVATLPELGVSRRITLMSRMLIGRQDAQTAQHLDLDLSDYDAQLYGVSRVHAALDYADQVLCVVDLGSKNGTFVNGERLTPYQSRPLRDGDELRFGRLIVRLHAQ